MTRLPHAYPQTDPPEPVWVYRLFLVRDVVLMGIAVVVIVLIASMTS